MQAPAPYGTGQAHVLLLRFACIGKYSCMQPSDFNTFQCCTCIRSDILRLESRLSSRWGKLSLTKSGIQAAVQAVRPHMWSRLIQNWKGEPLFSKYSQLGVRRNSEATKTQGTRGVRWQDELRWTDNLNISRQVKAGLGLGKIHLSSI